MVIKELNNGFTCVWGVISGAQGTVYFPITFSNHLEIVLCNLINQDNYLKHASAYSYTLSSFYHKGLTKGGGEDTPLQTSNRFIAFGW